MNELVEKAFYSIFTKEDIDMLVRFDELEKRVKAMRDSKNAELIEFLKANNVESFEDENIKVVYKKPFTRKVVDTQKLKDEGLFDLYCKETDVKESVIVNVKYE